jgi:hypothetical protein
MKQWKKVRKRIQVSDGEIYYEACKVAGIVPSGRQSSRWREKKGKAYAKRTTALRRIVQRVRRDRGELPVTRE